MPGSPVVFTSALFAMLALGGCTTDAPKPPSEPSLYQRLGGTAAIGAMVDETIVNISADPRINRHFVNAEGPNLKRNLVELICARTGGPCTYAGRDMASAHEGMNIRDDEFDAMVEDLAKSLDQLKVPPREKREALAILGQMRNAIVGH